MKINNPEKSTLHKYNNRPSTKTPKNIPEKSGLRGNITSSEGHQPHEKLDNSLMVNLNTTPILDAQLLCKPCDSIYDYLLNLLLDLEGIMQSAKHHPERDTLYHSLQVFQCAQEDTDDPELLAAALFHDIGKAIDYPNHAEVGADVLRGVLNHRICWLIEHHLDLLVAPKRCRVKYAGTSKLTDLEKLRKWDLAGRKTYVSVQSEIDALHILAPTFPLISPLCA